MEREVAIWEQRQEQKEQVDPLLKSVCQKLDDLERLKEEDFIKKSREGDRIWREAGSELAELCVREKLKDLPTVESIEPATAEEREKGVDFWVEIKGWDERIGVQFAIEKIKEVDYPRFVDGKVIILCELNDEHKGVLLHGRRRKNTIDNIEGGMDKLIVDLMDYNKEQIVKLLDNKEQKEKGNDIDLTDYVPTSVMQNAYTEIINGYLTAKASKVNNREEFQKFTNRFMEVARVADKN